MPEKKIFDVLIVGGGPAGLAAAHQCARAAVSTGIVDDNPTLGGQIWRGETRDSKSEAAKWLDLRGANLEILTGTQVFHADSQSRTLFAESRFASFELRYKSLILATGARERLLPFPGWTLPNVMAAGGLQAMAKTGLPLRGKSIVVAGTGPLLLAVAAYLAKRGANVAMVIEQASLSALASFGLSLATQPHKILQALGLARELAGVPFSANTWLIEAKGNGVLRSVVLSRKGRTEELPCDYLACGFHLVPNTELPALLGCNLRDGFVEVDEFQRTSVEHVYCAGEPTGIGGVESSLLEGEIAGLSAAGLQQSTSASRRRRHKLCSFGRRLDSTFKLRPELRTLAEAGTIVCRCEDVVHGRLVPHRSWRAAKLHTRCGMGPCQGRVCGPATQFLFGWQPDSVRPPTHSVRFENLAMIERERESVRD